MMPRGDEDRVAGAFCVWLRDEGWDVKRDVDHVDVVASRDGVQLLAEVKGMTSSPGLDVDTAYGQLLRRMLETPQGRVRYALVVPEEVMSKALRVAPRIREMLAIEIFAVGREGRVVQR